MKTKKVIFYILMLFPLAAVIISLTLLPDQIPVHYNSSNQVDRWGSKYESLIIPAITILFGLFMIGMSRLAAKHEKNGSNNESVTLVVGIVSLAIFDAMTVFFLYAAFNRVENLSSVSVDINQLVFGILGISMVVIGNIMPKLKKNSLVGVRTSRSMKSDVLWKKSQRFGGICFIIGGAAIIIISILTKSTLCIALSLSVTILIAIACVIYPYLVKE